MIVIGLIQPLLSERHRSVLGRNDENDFFKVPLKLGDEDNITLSKGWNNNHDDDVKLCVMIVMIMMMMMCVSKGWNNSATRSRGQGRTQADAGG